MTPPTLGVLGESQSLSFFQEVKGMGLVQLKGEDKVLFRLWWRCTLGVLHAGLLGLCILDVQSSELLSLLQLLLLWLPSSLPSFPQFEKSSRWEISSNKFAILWPSFTTQLSNRRPGGRSSQPHHYIILCGQPQQIIAVYMMFLEENLCQICKMSSLPITLRNCHNI